VCGSNPGIYVTLSDYIVFAKLSNSLVNPVIYAITTSQFRQSLNALIKKLFCPNKRRSTFTTTTTTTNTRSSKT
jgi:hypothetical protein